MKRALFVATIIVALLPCASTFGTVTIEIVVVGNRGNEPDTRNNAIGFGSVSYSYQIGKYEVTAGQYTEFLNAVAKADPNGLYSTQMSTSTFGAKIERTGLSPNFSYSVASDWANRPVGSVSFWDAARFANWLHNGKPTGAQGPGTTEDGAYHDVGNQVLFGRNAGATFFIPSEDEWYKAAYHDKSAGLAESYFVFPTGNTTPGRDRTESFNPGHNSNYKDTFYLDPTYFRTVVGDFELSASAYGTFDQGGNVWEWTETKIASSARVVRGGSFAGGYGDQLSYFYYGRSPDFEFNDLGFRVAVVPEPSTMLLASFGMIAVSRFVHCRQRPPARDFRRAIR
jgi:formylglycine-generating enzyme required for sulfatase activity